MSTQTKHTTSPTTLSKVAVKLFFRIADEWGLNDEQKCVLAGVNSRSTLYNWKGKVEKGSAFELNRDQLDRLSYIAGIYKGIQILFSDPKQWKQWIKKPNNDFGGNSALEVMMQGGIVDLADVRRYLDGWRGDHHV